MNQQQKFKTDDPDAAVETAMEAGGFVRKTSDGVEVIADAGIMTNIAKLLSGSGEEEEEDDDEGGNEE